MKATIRYQKVEGYYGQTLSNGTKWLIVKSKKSGRSYPIAQCRASDNEVIFVEPVNQLSDFTNDELVAALMAAE